MYTTQSSLYLILENITNGSNDFILDLFSLIAILFSIYVIITKNPIVSVLHLIGLFVAVSLLLLSLGMTYLGLSYLLVYVGAISILFLFILMLINIRVSELHHDSKNIIPLTILVGTCINNIYFKILPYSIISMPSFFSINSTYVLGNWWETVSWDSSHIMSLGNIIYSVNPMLILVVSLILMLSMIGSIVITIQKDDLGLVLRQ